MFYSQTYIDTTLYTQTQSDAKYAPKANPALTGTATAVNITESGTIAAPTINATSTLQVGGANINTLYKSRHWAYGSVNSGGSIATSGGAATGIASVLTGTTGVYTVSWANSGTTPVYAYIQLKSGTLGFITYGGLSTTQVTVYTYTTASAAANLAFNFLVILA